ACAARFSHSDVMVRCSQPVQPDSQDVCPTRRGGTGAGTRRARRSVPRPVAGDGACGGGGSIHATRMSGNLEFQYPWLLALLALLPLYAFLRGRAGKHSALRFPSADIARAAGATARAAAGRLLLFRRLLVVAVG